jgi:hypothetical protein
MIATPDMVEEQSIVIRETQYLGCKISLISRYQKTL